eukprot:CAMPEP_0198291070 /NCGR_PEP_ID=MMETSP1449-20131203/8723_1 /TAXON_ID=420275 /ORGANISM="Attheya septentrionalis, Strain CCMP2084" /LENGTH=362 /DNA_ID=CAMNT_0043989665 /DNA_START=67 /DNA_END=1155 /DNA_ORIENTATION=-
MSDYPAPTNAFSNSNTLGKKPRQKQTRSRKAIAAFRKRKDRDYAEWKGRIGIHVQVDEFNLNLLEDYLADWTDPSSKQKEWKGWEYVNHYDVIRLWKKPLLEESFLEEGFATDDSLTNAEQIELMNMKLDAATPEIFIFSFGAAVFWNFPNEESELTWLKTNLLLYDDVCGTLHKEAAITSANDEVNFVYGPDFVLRRDVVQLSTREPGEKLAVSFGVAKSSLLSVYEWMLQQTIERNSDIPEQLAKTGTIHMSKIDISKEIGRIFLVKHGINLDSNLQDTPEEFWEDTMYDLHYTKTMSYFEIHKRMELINNRLKMLQDLHKVLIDEVQNHHAVYLEWIVIWLIVIEVVFELYHAFRDKII